MRRRLFKFLNILSSYPVLILLGLLVGGIFYLGAGTRSIEFRWQSLLSRSIELKQEQQQLNSEIQGLRQSDAYKRAQIFQRQFMAFDAVDTENFRRELLPVFESQGWHLRSVKAGEVLSDPTTEGKPSAAYFGAAEVAIVATVPIVDPISGTAFLPFHSIDRIADYLWRKPPTKEIKSLRIERTASDYKLSVVFLYPLAHDHILSDEPTE
jgi:hypothetical protein